MAQMPVRFTTTINPQPLRSVRKIKQFQLMVGVPASSAARPSTGGRPDPNNAALLYIHENGSPAAHIPARPSLHPGVNRVRQQIIALLRAGAAAAAAGKGEALLIRNMNTAGLLAVNSVRGVIRAHIPPPLAATTKMRRLTRTAAYQAASAARQKAMMAVHLAGTFTPLYDTGKLINAITYVIRRR